MNWFLYDRNLQYERANQRMSVSNFETPESSIQYSARYFYCYTETGDP